jgi:hypothetical protein
MDRLNSRAGDLEDDRLRSGPALRGDDRLAERIGAAVIGVFDRDHGRKQDPILHPFHPEPAGTSSFGPMAGEKLKCALSHENRSLGKFPKPSEMLNQSKLADLANDAG